MKRVFCLLFLCIFLLSGCSFLGERIKEPVTFYYVRANYQKNMEQVIGSEIREAAGHREDLPYLLVLYSMGPSNAELTSVLPRNTTITLTEYLDDSIQLELSESAEGMTDVDFTLACACISMTCMELADIQQVILVCGDRNITMQKDKLLQYNNFSPNLQEDVK